MNYQTTSYGQIVRAYDAGRGELPERVRVLIRMLVGHPRLVLDVGCGTGISTRAIAGAAHTTIGCEPDMAMLCRAVAKARPDTAFIACTARDLPFPSRSVDGVILVSSLHWFADEASLARMIDVLKPTAPIAAVNRRPGGILSDLSAELRALSPSAFPSPKLGYDPARLLEGAGMRDIRRRVVRDARRLSVAQVTRYARSKPIWAQLEGKARAQIDDVASMLCKRHSGIDHGYYEVVVGFKTDD